MALDNFVRSIQNIMRGDAGINGDAQRIEQMGWMLFLKVWDAREEEWELYEDGFTSIIPAALRWRNWAADRKDGSSPTGDALLRFVNEELFPGLKALPVGADTPARQAIVRSVFEDSNQYMKDGVLLRQVLNVIDAIDFDDWEESHAFGDIYEAILKDLQSAGNAGEFYTPRAVTDFMVGRLAPKLGERVADFAAGTCGFLTSALKALEPQAQTVEGKEQYRRSVYGVEKKPMPYLLGITNLLLHGIDSPELYHGNALERDVRDLREADRFDVILMNPPYGGAEQEAVKANFPADMRSSETADLFMALATYRLKRGGRAAVIIPDGFLFGTDGPKAAIKKRLLESFDLHTVVRMPAGVFSPYTSITTNILFFEHTKPTQDIWFYRVPPLSGNRAYSKTRPFTLDRFDACVQWWDDRSELVDDDGIPMAIKISVQNIQAAGYNLDCCGYATKTDIILNPQEAFMDLQRSFNVMREKMSLLEKLLEDRHAGH